MSGHIYHTADGQRVPGVTTVLGILDKPGLLRWYGKLGTAEAERQRDFAADLGTRTHDACESIAKGVDVLAGCSFDILPHVEKFSEWFTTRVERVLACEVEVISEQHRYGGRLDLAAVIDGENTLIDLKTSKAYDGKPHPEWGAQVSAYASALWETSGILCTRRMVVQLPSNQPGTLTVHELPRDEMRSDFSAFLACLQLYHWRLAHNRKPPPIALSMASGQMAAPAAVARGCVEE